MVKRHCTSSGLSQAIKQAYASEAHIANSNQESPQNVVVRLANSKEDREAVFRLGYQVYLEKGYISENEYRYLIHDYDFDPNTAIFMVLENQQLVGSTSLVFEESSVLPCEALYHDELLALRQQGKRVAELSRLVIDKQHRNSKEILITLFNYFAIYLQRVMLYDGIVIQVNPRHVTFYKALMHFEEIGGEKLYEAVNGAPAVLLYIDGEKHTKRIEEYATYSDRTEIKDRSLYRYFLKPQQEGAVADYLKRCHKPITEAESEYFLKCMQANQEEISV